MTDEATKGQVVLDALLAHAAAETIRDAREFLVKVYLDPRLAERNNNASLCCGHYVPVYLTDMTEHERRLRRPQDHQSDCKLLAVLNRLAVLEGRLSL